MAELERRVRVDGLELREDEGATITGYAAVFNERAQIGGFWEMIAPGAFARTLASNPDVRATVEHEGGLTTIGRTRNNSLALAEDERGLRVAIRPPDTQAGRDVMELVRGGYVDQMSFAFRVAKGGEEWTRTENKEPLRILRDVELNDGDVSIVSYPAYPSTSAEARDMAAALAQAGDGAEQVDSAEQSQARQAARIRKITIMEKQR